MNMVSAHRREQVVPPVAAAPVRSVCFITEARGFGGVEVHTLGMMKALIERGVRIELVVNRYQGYDDVIVQRGWQDAVTIVHTDLDGILYGEPSDADGWESVLRGIRADTLIFPKGNNNFGQIGFLQVCRRKFARVVFIEHLEPYERPSGGRKWLGVIPGLGLWWRKRRFHSRRGAACADRIITVSNRVRDRLLQDFQYPAAKLSVVRNGVPWRDFARDAEVGAAFRSAHGIPARAFVFGMLVRLSPEKGVDVALRAFRQLLDARPDADAYLLVAGEGDLRAELETLATELRLGDRVRFVGFVAAPKTILPAFDSILFSSTLEGLPLGLLEGMAAGCVPIVTRVSGMPEAVDSADIGWVVEPRDPVGLGRAMAAAVDLDADTLARMRDNVVARVREHFDIARCHEKILELCGLGTPS